MKTILSHTFLACTLMLLAACETPDWQGIQGVKLERDKMNESIRAEQPGEYFIGRRYYKRDYKFWGFIRQPGQPWSTAKLVMLNEKVKLAPDRAIDKIGSDNNYEYKLYGKFTGDTVYEPASNGFYPEFQLTGYELITISPAPIFHTAEATDPERRVIGSPY